MPTFAQVADWLPEECWDNITELDRLPGFHGLAATFAERGKEWHDWYLHPEPETLPLIGRVTMLTIEMY
ncbi:unnamed protein product [Plutella xylostella]|uniref:(diamondback moth) hypothetical protein n=1 Tax=Plutella xylostella TaxID=51655 RepID=A0A8S4FM80_PLUXY|nr:unnamed protein product [Plutella xylostella]